MRAAAATLLLLAFFLPAARTAAAREARKRIVVAAGDSFAPQIFRNARGEPAGRDVDLWRLWSRKTGVEVEIRLMTWSDAIPALLAGDVDVVDGVSRTPEREALLEFTAPYGELNSYIFFHESLGGVPGVEDLSGFLVGVIRGSNVEEHVSREAPGIERQPYANFEEMVRAALDGRLRVFVAEEPVIPYQFAKAGRTGGFRRADRVILTTDLRMAVRKGETDLLAEVQRGLDAISRDERKRIEERWAGVSLTGPMPWGPILGVAAVLLVAGLGLVGWNRLLRGRISEATRTIRKSEERFRALVETTSDWIWEVDEELRYTYVSPTVTRLLGFTPEEVLGRGPMDLMPTEEADRVKAIIAPFAAERAPIVGLVKVCLAKDGREVVLETSGLPILDREGRFRGYRGVDRDITERQSVEQELRGEKDFSTLVINSLPGIFYLYEDGQRLVRWNRNLEAATGYDAEELLGRSPLEWFDGEDAAHIADRIGRVFETGEATAEARLIRKDGVRVPYYFTGQHLTTEEGSYLLGVGIDITQRRSLEAQLRHSQKMEAVGLLAGGVAHDFNNILQAVLGYNEIVLENLPEDSPVRDQLLEVRRAAERAATLTQQLLSFSRRKALERVNLNLNAVITDLSRMLRRVIGEHVELTLRTEPRIRTISADLGQIEQVLMNVCINARDAMPEGGTLTLETRNVRFDEEAGESRPWAKPGDFVLLRISDTGKGIPEGIRDRLFEPFFTTKGVGEGTGLGLATVYAIVERHGGMIEVESEDGVGATFRIYLPASLGPEASARERGAPAEPVAGHETILVAEDDGPVRDLAIEVLETAGYRLLVAEDGREAIRLLEERGDEVHLAFLDVVMPKTSGGEVYEFIRRRHPLMPVLFTSGYSRTILEEHNITGERCRLLQKPYSPSDLLREIRISLSAISDRR